jgi:uncharacterized protein YegP (UPF0339 family)
LTWRRSSYLGEVYRSKNGWRWRAKARNGKIVADSAEAYVNYAHAVRMVRKVCRVKEVKVLTK